ncbi:MAG: hypothetical protein ACYCQJ_03420 [Nitrososphaerales archaeon]
MKGRTFSSNKRKRSKAISSVVGGVLMLSVMLTVGYGYFMFVSQSEQSYIDSAIQNNMQVAQQDTEHLGVIGTLVGPAIGFYVNNTGIAATITSFFVTDQSTGQIDQFNAGGDSLPALPYSIGQGQSILFKSAVLYSPGHYYTIKLLTSRGSNFVGTYPPKEIRSEAIGALVAEGIGSISMEFSSYNYYSVAYSGGKWIVDLSNPHSAALLPNGITPVFSMKITNNDPGIGTISVDSHTDLWLYNVCPAGCGTEPLFTFYAVNVAPNGTITSTTQGSFSQINIPYGSTQTIYFGSANDLSSGSFSSITMSEAHNVALGEYDVFIIISGSDSTSIDSVLYAQNLPFAGTFFADNVAWYSETPELCTHSSLTTFSLTVNNSEFSSYGIYQISINGSSLSNVAPTQTPSGWKSYDDLGVVTWNTTKNGQYIAGAKSSKTFGWSGTAPTSIGTQFVFLVTIYWTGGTVSIQQSAAGCYVS